MCIVCIYASKLLKNCISQTTYICYWELYNIGDLFKDARRQAVQVKGHTHVIVPDVEVPDFGTFITTSAQ